MTTNYRISELREKCQLTRESSIYRFNWFEKRILRFFSIYITYAAGSVGLTANGMTYISTIVGLTIPFFFFSGIPILWLVGALLFYLHLILDCSDGELARLNNTVSSYGKFLESALPSIVYPIIVFSWYYGLSIAYDLNYVTYLGVITSMLMLSWSVGYLTLRGLLLEEKKRIEDYNISLYLPKRLASIIFSIDGLVNALLLCSALAVVGEMYNINWIRRWPQLIYTISYSVARLMSIIFLVRRVKKTLDQSIN